MSRDPLRDVAALTAAVQAAEEARMRALITEERRIRHDIATLEECQRAALSLAEDELSGLRSLGGDMLWQGWVSRTRRDLQMQLARALARKDEGLRRLRRAHGRASASEALLEDAREAEYARGEKQRVEQEQGLILFKAATKPRPG